METHIHNRLTGPGRGANRPLPARCHIQKYDLLMVRPGKAGGNFYPISIRWIGTIAFSSRFGYNGGAACQLSGLMEVLGRMVILWSALLH